jgi:hypothetical protein
MAPAEYELAFAASERPQTHAATGIGIETLTDENVYSSRLKSISVACACVCASERIYRL